jgi:hypothetical protein
MEKLKNLIHVGCLFTWGQNKYVFLRKINPHTYTWFEQEDDSEKETVVTAINIEEALRLASRHWTHEYFRMLNCGFRYTLPERDEHGINALFHQMVASYSSMNGIYFDEEIGCNCFVQNGSEEARNLWKQLKANEKTS